MDDAFVTIKRSKTLTKEEKKNRDKEWKDFDQELYSNRYSRYKWQVERCFKAMKNNELIGFAYVYMEGGVMWIEELLVFKRYRGQGVGQKIMDEVLAFAKEENLHKIILETHPKIDAVKFYRRNGFKTEAKLPNHYAHDEAILMSKYIKGDTSK